MRQYNKPKQINRQEKSDMPIEPTSAKLEKNVESIRNIFFYSDDICERIFTFNGNKGILMFVNSIADQDLIQLNVLKPLFEIKSGDIENTVNISLIHKSNDLNYCAQTMVEGHCLLMMEDETDIYLLNVANHDIKDIQEPDNEQIVRGSHQGFSENIIVNIHLIRERIKTPALRVKLSSIGETSNSKFALLYIENLSDPQLINEIERRISYLKIDSIQSPGHFEEFLEDYPFSPFPQFLNTERPDRTAAHLMEGRVALIMEGSSTALIFPVTFFSFFQSSEDYNQRTFIGSFFRMIRLLSFIIALGLPAFYVAIISFNYEVIPAEIIFSIKSSLEFVPFPPVIEAMLMQVTLELLREAAVRLPTPIAQTIGVVGGLVIGTAIVEAHLVSNTMIIVVAITAISSFVIPSNEMSNTIRVLGFPIMVMAAIFGFLGIVISVLILFIHLVKLKPFGCPYFFPLAPLDFKGLKDSILRFPIWAMNVRPKDANPVYRWKESYSRGWKKNADK
ncbi:spore germination protein KA [Bacillus ectoiniformans]|uniref:spore germination protein n=1 Tax=Bacillus ectoiniformans TaxID=1494429 RepID=UPI001958E132|nr:spore germination protein [Bacillus ectoiniformans]MBM7649107.1 spore germination protein KA [Bacillus ectoiniformans]